MRVLHIGKYYPPCRGGMEYYLRDLCAAQRRVGIEPFVLAHDHLRGRGSVDADDAGLGATVIRAPTYGTLFFAPISPGFPRLLARAIRELSPDLLHIHMPNTSAFWALLIPAARRLPWVIHWHSDVFSDSIDPRLRLAYRFYQPFERAMLRRAARVIATSPPYLDYSAALARWRDRCVVVPLGIDRARMEGVRSAGSEDAEPWREGALRVLAVGRLTYYKGFDLLLRAAAGLPDIHVRIVGTGERQRAWSDLAESLGIGARIELLGDLGDPELAALFDSCDLLCLPSVERTEAFGLVLLEAMAIAKPCVVTDVPGSGMSWVVQDGETGLVSQVGDADSLAAALRRLADDPELRRRMGRNGLERFRARFDIRATVPAIQELYTQVLS